MLDLGALEVVSWDVDGTLYSLPRLRLAIAAAALRGVVAFPTHVRERRELERWRARMDEVRRAGGALPAALRGTAAAAERERVRILERRWYGAALARIGPRPEVAPLHAALAARGVRQVVLSDYDSDYKLAALGLSRAFDAVFSGEGMGWLKPAPELYRQVARALGVAPARWLHIGDRVDRDQRPARSIGCQTLILGRDRLPI